MNKKNCSVFKFPIFNPPMVTAIILFSLLRHVQYKKPSQLHFLEWGFLPSCANWYYFTFFAHYEENLYPYKDVCGFLPLCTKLWVKRKSVRISLNSKIWKIDKYRRRIFLCTILRRNFHTTAIPMQPLTIR